MQGRTSAADLPRALNVSTQVGASRIHLGASLLINSYLFHHSPRTEV